MSPPDEGKSVVSAFSSERDGLTGGGPTGAKPEKHHVADDEWGEYLKNSLTELFFGSKLNVLLFLLPVAIASDVFGWDGSITFVASLLALCPLAERIGA